MNLNKPKPGLIIAGLLIGLGLGLAWYFGLGPGITFLSALGTDSGNEILAPEVNRLATDFELVGLDGNRFQLSTQFGKPIVINFWASWCIPCREEMPLLQDFSDRNGGVKVIGINFDESEELVREFTEANEIKFQILMDPDGKIVDLYRIRGFPSTMFIDEYGVLRYQHVGILTEGQLGEYVRELGVESR